MNSKVRKKLIREKLSEYRGIVISESTEIEMALGLRLRRYFFPKSNRQASILGWELINPLSFHEKIALYEKIPDFKKTKIYTKVRKVLKDVQYLRNAMAHWHLDEKGSNENEIKIYRFNPWKTLKLNDKLIAQFIENEKFLLTTFGWGTVVKEKYGNSNMKK